MYKGVGARESEYLVASALAHFVRTFGPEISATLGGEPDCVCITPSKRGVSYDRQPLRRIADAAETFLPPVTGLVHLRPEQAWSRNEYTPEAFDGNAEDIEGRRIILLEDTVVTGGTVVSVAGSTYLKALDREWDPESNGWPRAS